MAFPLLQVQLQGKDYKLKPGTGVTKRPITEWALKTSAGDLKRTDRSLAETWTIEDLVGGLGVEFSDPVEDKQRIWEADVDTRIRRQVTLPGLQTDSASAGLADVLIEYNGNIYHAWGTTTGYCRRYNVSLARWEYWDTVTSTWVITGGTELTLTSGPISAFVYKAKLYIAVGTTVANSRYDVYDDTAATWTLNAGTGQAAAYFCEYDNKLVLIDKSGNVKSSTDGTTWTANASLGTPTTINGIIPFFDRRGDPALYVGTSSGLYILDFWAQKFYPFYSMAGSQHADNCKAMVIWRDALYVSIRDNVVRVQPGSTSIFTDIGPGSRDAGLVSSKDTGVGYGRQGSIIQMLPLTNMLLMLIKSGSSADRMNVLAFNGKGYHSMVLGSNDAEGKNVTRTAMCFTTVFSPARLYFGTATKVYYIPLPDTTDNPYLYSGFTYGASGTLFTPWHDGGMSEVAKGYYAIEVTADGCTSTETITISYSQDGGTTWTQLTDSSGTADLMNSSPHKTLYFGGKAGLSAKTLRLKMVFARGGTTTTTPVFRYAVVKFLKRPTRRYGYDFIIDAATSAKGGDTEQIFTDIETAEATVTLIDFTYAGNGTSYVVVTDAVKPQKLPRYASGKRKGLIQMRVAEAL